MFKNLLDIEWGAPGTPLLPGSLRNLWSGEPLPAWIASEFHLREAATASQLDESIWDKSGLARLADRHRNFLLNLVQGRRAEIWHVHVFTQPVPHWLDLNELPFSTRTRNCLARVKSIAEADQLAELTFGRLFEVQAMGVVSILEFACFVEAASHRLSEAGPPNAFSEDELLAVVSEPWVDQVGAADPRFADVIPPIPRVTIYEILDGLTSGLREDSQNAPKARGRNA